MRRLELVVLVLAESPVTFLKYFRRPSFCCTLVSSSRMSERGTRKGDYIQLGPRQLISLTSYEAAPGRNCRVLPAQWSSSPSWRIWSARTSSELSSAGCPKGRVKRRELVQREMRRMATVTPHE